MNDTKITLADLSVNDINTIFAGLGKLPLDAAFDVFMRMKTQAEAQIVQSEAPKEE